MTNILPRYVAVLELTPAAMERLDIAKGSAIVCRMTTALKIATNDVDDVDIWFEGNLYGAVNLVYLSQRITTAVGRMMMDYPTMARARIHADEGWIIAIWDSEQSIMRRVIDIDALTEISADAIEMIPAKPNAAAAHIMNPETVTSITRKVFRSQDGMFWIMGEPAGLHPTDQRLPDLMRQSGLSDEEVSKLLPRPKDGAGLTIA